MIKKDEMEEMFDLLKNQWDVEEPALGHQQRFLKKLATPKKKFHYKTVFAVAASIAVLLCVVIKNDSFFNTPQPAKMSAETKEAQLYFNSVIKKELAALQKEDAPESKKIITDALFQMQALENDYKKLTAELAEKGENKQIIYAMITNLQTRITFLQEVMQQIETIKKIKADYHGKNTL